jgi:integrase
VGRENGKQKFAYTTPSHFPTKRERDDAVAELRTKLRLESEQKFPLVEDYVDRYLAEYERRNKQSAYETQKQRLQRFRKDFEGKTLDVSRADAKDWVNSEGQWSGKPRVTDNQIAPVVTLYNHAIDDDDIPLPRNPFRKLSRRSKGRSEQAPPTEAEFQRLLDSCSALGDYQHMMRALTKFAAFTLMRPSELYGLEWPDIDMDAMRIRKDRRVYKGDVDEPKTGRKLIALTPPARDALVGLPRNGLLVFRSKTGRRLSQSGMSGYWRTVCAAAGLDFDFYHASKHYGVWYMWTQLRMSPRAIAAQAGWSLKTVDAMLEVYGHRDVGALNEVDEAFASVPANVVSLKVVGQE